MIPASTAFSRIISGTESILAHDQPARWFSGRALQKTGGYIHEKGSKILGTATELDTQTQRVVPWFAVDGDHTLRLDYDLTPKSVVFDLGGYEGEFAAALYCMYRPNIYIFEPMPKYVEAISRRFMGNSDFRIFDFGLSDRDKVVQISIDEDSSSAYKTSESMVNIKLRKARDFFSQEKIGHIDLLKINIEGGEYDLLPHLIETGYILNISNVQVQFHDFVPNAEVRMRAIQEKLARTHELTYEFPFVWENWRLAPIPFS